MENLKLNREITRFLVKLGVPTRIKGFTFVRDAIVYSIANGDTAYNMTGVIYPYITNKHNISSVGAERATRYAIHITWEQSNAAELLNDIFGYDNKMRPYAPTIREFLTGVTEYLIYEVLSA